MDINEAKMTVARWFIEKYVEWFNDYNSDMDDREYSRKYGWRRNGAKIQDTQKQMLWFQSHVCSGKYLRGWKEIGIDPAMVYELHRDGFFSFDYCSSYKARMLGKTDFYYLSQKKVKEIYKAYKSGLLVA